MHRLVFAAVVSVVLFSTSYSAQQPGAPPATSATGDFVRDVRAILEQHCYECHGPDKQMNGFRLDRRRDAMRGGTLPVIGPGSSKSSRLYLRLTGTSYGRQMPFEEEPLSSAEITTIKDWIDQGAAWPEHPSRRPVGPPPPPPPPPAPPPPPP